MSVNRVVRTTVAAVAAVMIVGWGVSWACDHGKEVAQANGKAEAKPAIATASGDAKAATPCAGKDAAVRASGESKKPCAFSVAAAEGKPCPHAAKADQAKDGAPCPHGAKTAAPAVAQSEVTPEPAPEKDGSN